MSQEVDEITSWCNWASAFLTPYTNGLTLTLPQGVPLFLLPKKIFLECNPQKAHFSSFPAIICANAKM